MAVVRLLVFVAFGLAVGVYVAPLVGSWPPSSDRTDASPPAPAPQTAAGDAEPQKTQPVQGALRESLWKIAVRKAMSDYTAPRRMFQTATFMHDGAERRWHWITPAGDAPAPTVILLHGSERTGRAMLDMLKGMARNGFFLIAPDSADPKGWSSASDGPDFLAALLEKANDIHTVDRGQLFLVGHSAGANHALWLGNQPDAPWRKIAVHAGSVDPRAVVPRTDAPPVMIVIGDQDAFFPLGEVRAAAESLAAAGHDVDLQVVPGHDHWFYIIGPRLADRFADFLAAP